MMAAAEYDGSNKIHKNPSQLSDSTPRQIKGK
jgi:hypothetical protein